MSLFKAHLDMLADEIRVNAYRNAIQETVRKGDIVADIGTGTGILAFFALQAGAGRVYAVESGPMIDVAKKMAEINGFHDNIAFIHKDSRETEIPEPVDIIVTETIGSLGIDESVVDILSDARNRFLKEGGKIIPSGLSLVAVPVYLAKEHPFHFLDKPFYEIRTSRLKELAVNNIYHLNTASSESVRFLSLPGKIFETGFYSCEPMTFPHHMEGSFKTTKEGTLHGMLLYPEIRLTEKTVLSLFGGGRFLQTHWNAAFFPVSKEWFVSIGETLSFRLTFTEKDGLVWQTAVGRKGRRESCTQLSAFGLPSLRHVAPKGEGDEIS